MEIFLAANDGDLERVQALVENGVDVDEIDQEYGETALMAASRNGYLDIVVFLVGEIGCKINIRNETKNGWTALMFAAFYGHCELAQYLAQMGADTTIRDNKDQTCFDIDPCVNSTKSEMIFAINEGLKDLQNYLREEQKASGEEEKDPNLSLATKDLSPSEVSQVIQSFSSLYKSTCQDFNQKPKDSIVNSLDLIITDNLDPHVLDLCGNPVSFSAPNIPRITDEQVFPLFEVLGHLMPNSPFSFINLSFNHIRNHGANALAVFLTHSQTLTGLNLRGNDIGEAGCIKMAENLSTQMTLKSLDLNTNPIGDTGMSKLADSLVANTTLTDLDIGNTELSTLTLVKMAVALTTNKTLTKLNIDKCLVGSIQEETTIHIAKALAKNATLTDLSMANHRIRDHGANWLAEYLGKNKTLQRLNLSCNYIGTDGVCALAAGISNRPVGCEILLDNNMNLKGAPTVDIEETIDESLTIDGQITVEYHTKGNNHSLVASMYNY